MSTRWWAPGTDVALDAMLAPGTDPESDLGLYLMAGHKAGAAALVEVAKSQIPSEAALVASLASARAVVADRMVDAIAAVTGPVYAGLLVRDVLDDADQGALDVFRTAVSKGVPPPMAMERAAAGYGMPSREMGAFAALAADPKANPRAVEDAADRSLMSYVSKVAAQEAVETISKAAAQRTSVDTDFDPAEHPRGPDGRFIDAPDAPPEPVSALERIRRRLGLSSTEPAVVGTTVRPAPADAVARRKKRAKRAQLVRQNTATRAPAQREAAARAPVQRQSAQRKASRSTLSRLADRLNVGTRLKGDPERAKLSVLPDLLHKLPDAPGRQYYDIGQPVIIGTSMLTGASIRTQAADQAMTQKDPSRRIFRIGHLVDKARYVDLQGRSQVESHATSARQEIEGEHIEVMAPIVQTVKHHELGNGDRADRELLDKKREDMAARSVLMPDGSRRKIIDHEEALNIAVLPVYEPLHVEEYDDMGRMMHDHEEAMAVVHFQPVDPERPDERAMPMVEEYVVLTDARGTVEGTDRQPQLSLDPNAIYEVVNAPHKPPGALVGPEKMWDLDEQVVVNRWYLRPVDPDEVSDIIEGIEKALTATELAAFNRLHPRDSEGQFVETPDQVQAPPSAREQAVARRKKRIKRVARTRQVQGSALRPVAAPVATRSATREPAQRKAPARVAARHPITTSLERKVAARAKNGKAPVLSDTRSYKLMNEQFFQNLFPKEETSDEAFLAMHRGEPLELNLRQKLIIGGMNEVPVNALGENMALNVNRLIEEQRVHRELLGTFEIPFQTSAVPDFDEIAEEVDSLLKKRPDLDLVELSLDDEDKQIMVFGAQVSGSYQNVVEIDPDMDWSGSVYLSYVGEHRATDMLAQGQSAVYSLVEDLASIDLAHEGAIPNPYVHYYRLTSSPVRRFRMDQG